MVLTEPHPVSSGRFDLDQSSFSPTELDESFMFYRQHPLKSNTAVKNATSTSNSTMTETTVVKAGQTSATTKVDFSESALTRFAKSQIKPKGTDDGFKGETAQVGSSVVRVANQIVSGRSIPEDSIPEPARDCEQLLAKFDPYRRRNSKSLPASPLQSPKGQRKLNQYFTTPFTEDKSKGWILSSLLAKREISQSMSFIGEEKKEELDRASSLASVDEMSSQGKTQKTEVFKARPSELREMNFWSPTSM